MSHYEHPERENARQVQRRRNQLTAVLVGFGVGLVFALLLGFFAGSWTFAIVVGVVITAAVAFGLNAVRKDSRKLTDDVPESR